MKKYLFLALAFALIFSACLGAPTPNAQKDKQGKELLAKLISYYNLSKTIKTKGLADTSKQESDKLIDTRDEILSLIKNDANTNYQDSYGNTPLYISTVNNDRSISKILIDKNASLEGKTPDGFSLLSAALQNSSIEGAYVLLENGANPDGAIEEAQKPLNIALLKSIQDNIYTNLAIHLVTLGANVNIKGEDDEPILLSAIKLQNTQLALSLIQKGADLGFVDEQGLGLLAWAVILKQNIIIKEIVEKAPEIISHQSTQYALVIAKATKNQEAIDYLMQRGVKTNKSLKLPKLPKEQLSKQDIRFNNMDFISLHQKSNGDIEIRTKDAIKKQFFLQRPSRLVFDFVRLSGARNFTQSVDWKLTSKILVGRHKGFYRLVFHIDKNQKLDIKKSDFLITIKGN